MPLQQAGLSAVIGYATALAIKVFAGASLLLLAACFAGLKWLEQNDLVAIKWNNVNNYWKKQTGKVKQIEARHWEALRAARLGRVVASPELSRPQRWRTEPLRGLHGADGAVRVRRAGGLEGAAQARFLAASAGWGELTRARVPRQASAPGFCSASGERACGDGGAWQAEARAAGGRRQLAPVPCHTSSSVVCGTAYACVQRSLCSSPVRKSSRWGWCGPPPAAQRSPFAADGGSESSTRAERPRLQQQRCASPAD